MNKFFYIYAVIFAYKKFYLCLGYSRLLIVSTAVAHIDEKDLLLRLRAGDQIAFERLYRRYSKPLYWKLQRLVKDSAEADELLQDLFVKVWEKREQIIIQQSFEAYLYRIAQRMVVDYFRKLARQSRMQQQVQLSSDGMTEHVEEYISAKETQKLLDDAIAQLPEQRRRAFTLCKIEGKSHQEAAEIMNISPNTVHNHLVKAVGSVKEYLEKAGKALSPLVLLLAVLPMN